MFIKYKFVHQGPDIINTLYMNVETVEFNAALDGCVVMMANEYVAYVNGDDIPVFMSALDRGDPVIDFNQFSDESSFCTRYGDRLPKAEGDN